VLCRAGWCVCVFSSRRRHTRLVSDWSSGVCSSDLHEEVAGPVGDRAEIGVGGWPARPGLGVGGRGDRRGGHGLPPRARWMPGARSEERRVGKEGGGGAAAGGGNTKERRRRSARQSG